MGRIPSIASLERRAQYLKTRKEKIDARQKQAPKIGSRGAAPRDDAQYKSTFTGRTYTVSASRKALQFFTGTSVNLATLGLAAPDIDDDKLPRGSKPALVIATVALAAPTPKTAISGRRYLKYTANNTQNNNSSFRAPISGATDDGLRTNFKNVFNAKKTAIGEYGRFSFRAESIATSLSGGAQAEAATT